MDGGQRQPIPMHLSLQAHCQLGEFVQANRGGRPRQDQLRRFDMVVRRGKRGQGEQLGFQQIQVVVGVSGMA